MASPRAGSAIGRAQLQAPLPQVAAERMPFGNFDQHDPDAVGVLEPHFDQPPGLGFGLAKDRGARLGQAPVLGPDVPDLHPDHGRALAIPGSVAGHLQHPLPEEEHHARIVGGPNSR